MAVLRALFYLTCITLDLVLSGLSLHLRQPVLGGIWAACAALAWLAWRRKHPQPGSEKA